MANYSGDEFEGDDFEVFPEQDPDNNAQPGGQSVNNPADSIPAGRIPAGYQGYYVPQPHMGGWNPEQAWPSDPFTTPPRQVTPCGVPSSHGWGFPNPSIPMNLFGGGGPPMQHFSMPPFQHRTPPSGGQARRSGDRLSSSSSCSTHSASMGPTATDATSPVRPLAPPRTRGGRGGRRRRVSGGRGPTDEEEAPAAPAPERPPRKKWTREEIVAFVGAYIRVTFDPIIGADQNSDSFWSRVYHILYEERKVPMAQRRQTSRLRGHWSEWMKRMKYFHSRYNLAMQSIASGETPDDAFNHAVAQYNEHFPTPWNPTHAIWWEATLIDKQFWTNMLARSRSDEPSRSSSKRSKTSSSGTYSTGAATTSENDAGPSQPSQRPIGTKQAKRKEKEVVTERVMQQVTGEIDGRVAFMSLMLNQKFERKRRQHLAKSLDKYEHKQCDLFGKNVWEMDEHTRECHQKQIAFIEQKIADIKQEIADIDSHL